MGLLDFAGGGGNSGVKSSQTTVDPGTEERISQLTNSATRPIEDLQAASMKGVGDQQLPSVDEMNRSQLTLGQNDPGTSAAIRSRYQGLLNNDLDSMERQSKYQAYQTKGQDIQRAYGVAHARNQVNLDNYKRQMAAYNANQKARAQAISSIFQTAGTIGAIMLTGGAAAPALAGGLMAGGAGDAGGAGGVDASSMA